MIKSMLIFCFTLASVTPAFCQDKNKEEILAVLNRQNLAWNSGDIEQFMVGYWQSDSLQFVSKEGITYGYNASLERYRKNYGDTARMGKLSFNILDVKRLSDQYYFVIGKWFLKRSVGDVGGIFTVLFNKINGKWVIVVDHSS